MARKKRVRNDRVDVVNKPKRVRKAGREGIGEEDLEDDNWLGGLGMLPEDFWSQYTLGCPIARGGFGQVHLMRSHKQSGFLAGFLACKVIPKPRGDAPTARARNAYKDDVTKVRAFTSFCKLLCLIQSLDICCRR